MANFISHAKRVAVITALVEGCSIRSTVRMTGVSKGAIIRLVESVGKPAEEVSASLLPYIKDPDRILVATLTHGYEGWLSKDAWEWMSKNGLNSRAPTQMNIPGMPELTGPADML